MYLNTYMILVIEYEYIQKGLHVSSHVLSLTVVVSNYKASANWSSCMTKLLIGPILLRTYYIHLYLPSERQCLYRSE